MELRSRSRSKTPFTLQSYEAAGEEVVEGSNHVTVTKRSSMRSTTTKLSSSSEHFSESRRLKSKSAAGSRRIATSDYSSEEGEVGEHHVTQNDKNQIIEDARAAANGTAEISALNLYRKAGRYWDKYPKTDWTYSPSSRDRVEIAPGVVAMPNMSRRTIHNSYDAVDSYSDYEDTTRMTSSLKHRLFGRRSANNNYDESYKISRVSSSSSSFRSSSRTFLSIVTSFFVTIYSTITSTFYSAYRAQNSIVVWIGKQFHHLASRVMLMDTWLLNKSQRRVRKTGAVLLLCLVPLLLFGGLHVLWASDVSLTPFCHPHCGLYITTQYNSFINRAYNAFN